MPALARADIDTATNKPKAEQYNRTKGSVVTEISVTARIDYILRFAKQAVLVVAEQTEQYSAIARQFLVSLSSEGTNEPIIDNHGSNSQNNVAFVSASSKLNDIQIRCRLIEQLFSNSLFDPEQSLVVSVLRLAKQQGEAVTIVVEHAHGLSLQIKYELSQLVAVAKQNKQVVNVVMFAQTKAADEISQNSNIFKNKLTIVDAATGQLYSGNNVKSSASGGTKWLSVWQKIILLISFFLMMVVSVSLYFYLQTEQGSKYLQQPVKEIEDTRLPTQDMVINKVVNKPELLKVKEQEKLSISVATKATQTANVQEINQALINVPSLTEADSQPAMINDVLSALLVIDKTQTKQSEVENFNLNKPVLPNNLDTNYYLRMSKESQGVVVQIAGFSDSQHWKSFISLYPEEEFYSYQKTHGDSVFTVITSKVFPDRLAAIAAMEDLPEAITKRELWVKPISTVITEINTFKE